VSANTLIVSTIQVLNAKHDYNSLQVLVLDDNENVLYEKTRVNNAKYSVTSINGGSYKFCVENFAKNPLNIAIDIKSGAQAKDYSAIASTADLLEAD
jgi:hypothetical protein